MKAIVLRTLAVLVSVSLFVAVVRYAGAGKMGQALLGIAAWLPILAAEAAAIVQNPFYLALIEVTTEFVTADRLCIEADVENLGL